MSARGVFRTPEQILTSNFEVGKFIFAQETPRRARRRTIRHGRVTPLGFAQKALSFDNATMKSIEKQGQSLISNFEKNAALALAGLMAGFFPPIRK